MENVGHAQVTRGRCGKYAHLCELVLSAAHKPILLGTVAFPGLHLCRNR